jgi:CubicO group peptidase (beta-lactamase class C family)
MTRAQRRMQELLNDLVRDGYERGIQLAVYLDGKLVVDVFAGVTDATAKRPVDGETLFPVFSCTKGIASTLAHILAERGKLNYDAPIAEYWPAFAANGKGGIKVRHALNHTAGLQFMPMGIGYKELCDWDSMCAAMAREKPVSAPGEMMAYHAVTYSWLVGEVLRRVDGRPFEKMLNDEICAPLGLRDLYVGIPDEVEPRVAMLDEIFEPGCGPSMDDSKPRDVPGWMQPLHTMMNRPEARRACIPASNGIMSARALARHYAALLPGGVDGVELLPASRIREATKLQKPSVNPETETAMRGLGYMIGMDVDGRGPCMSAFGHGGYGGAQGFGDYERRLAVGLTKNLYSVKGTQGRVLKELLEALEI